MCNNVQTSHLLICKGADLSRDENQLLLRVACLSDLWKHGIIDLALRSPSIQQVLDVGFGSNKLPLLHRIARKGSLTLFEQVVERGANVSALGGCGSTVIHQLLLRSSWDQTVDKIFALCLQRVREHGGDLPVFLDLASQPGGLTALHLACKAGRTEAIDLLLDNGACTDVQTTEGLIPLHFALQH
ncbi:hypothetical protein GUITHDRAFT_73152, partial [Guillardia theta CCMP2712]